MIAKISEKGQLTIPAGIRKKLNLSQGSLVRIAISGQEIRLIPENKSLSSLRGIVKTDEKQDFKAIRETVMGDVVCE